MMMEGMISMIRPISKGPAHLEPSHLIPSHLIQRFMPAVGPAVGFSAQAPADNVNAGSAEITRTARRNSRESCSC